MFWRANPWDINGRVVVITGAGVSFPLLHLGNKHGTNMNVCAKTERERLVESSPSSCAGTMRATWLCVTMMKSACKRLWPV